MEKLAESRGVSAKAHVRVERDGPFGVWEVFAHGSERLRPVGPEVDPFLSDDGGLVTQGRGVVFAPRVYDDDAIDEWSGGLEASPDDAGLVLDDEKEDDRHFLY